MRLYKYLDAFVNLTHYWTNYFFRTTTTYEIFIQLQWFVIKYKYLYFSIYIVQIMWFSDDRRRERKDSFIHSSFLFTATHQLLRSPLRILIPLLVDDLYCFIYLSTHRFIYPSIFLPIYNALSVFSMTAYVTYKKSPSWIETLQSFSSFVSAKADSTYLFFRLGLKRSPEYNIEGHPELFFWFHLWFMLYLLIQLRFRLDKHFQMTIWT